MRWRGVPSTIVTLVATLTLVGCSQTTRISSEILDRAVCETADYYRFRPSRATWERLTEAERLELRQRLDAYRAQGCPGVLGR